MPKERGVWVGLSSLLWICIVNTGTYLLVIRMTKVNISLDSNYFANQLLCLGMLNLLLTSHSVKTGV